MSRHVQHCYGRLPVRHDERTLNYATYQKARLVAPPLRANWYGDVTEWPVFLNDRIGDCTIAALAHMIEAWTQYALGREVSVTDEDVQRTYEAITGYDPSQTRPDGTNPTDRGANELDVLKYWRRHGIAGHKIVAFLRIDPHNHRQLKQAIATFGGVYAGFNVPQSAEDQFAVGDHWHVVDGSPIIGAHAVPILGYDPANYYTVTWGALQAMTGRFLDTYFEECYAVVTSDFLDKTGHDPQGLDLRQLLADLDALD